MLIPVLGTRSYSAACWFLDNQRQAMHPGRQDRFQAPAATKGGEGMKGLRQALASWDIEPPCRIPDVLRTHPKSLKEIVCILNLPAPKLEAFERRKAHEFSENNAQGLAYAYGQVWFLSSERNLFKCSVTGEDLYRPTFRHLAKRSLSRLLAEAGLDEDGYDHIGDLDYCDGLLFAPIRHRSHRTPHALLALSEDLEVVGYAVLLQNTKDSWCAINPWNKLLYMPSEDSKGLLVVYDPSPFFAILPHRSRWGERVDLPPQAAKSFYLYREDGTLDRVSGEGASFSANGWLLLSEWYCRTHAFGECIDFANSLRIYSALTGVRFDKREYNFDGHYDEIEGVSIHPSGIFYVAVCDNDVWDSDEFMIYAFR